MFWCRFLSFDERFSLYSTVNIEHMPRLAQCLKVYSHNFTNVNNYSDSFLLLARG